MSTAARLRPAAAPQHHPLPATPPTRHEVALDALTVLWAALEGMGHDDAQRFLTGPAASFLVGLDVAGVLDALRRDRTRREARR